MGMKLHGNSILASLGSSASGTVATCNHISKLPPEFSRAERFDGVFFLDLPDRQQRQKVWDIYLKLFDLDAGQAKPKDDQ
jgi:SpoVK/Ycf46/Vps4 family AAA+-type ATPase